MQLTLVTGEEKCKILCKLGFSLAHRKGSPFPITLVLVREQGQRGLKDL